MKKTIPEAGFQPMTLDAGVCEAEIMILADRPVEFPLRCTSGKIPRPMSRWGFPAISEDIST